MTSPPIHIVGGGLAGSEAAWQIAARGLAVVLHEMRPVRMTEAHQTDQLAELVCSNSFRSDDATTNAVGLLHAEMRLAGSLIMRAADANQVPAGGDDDAVPAPRRQAGKLLALDRDQWVRCQRGRDGGGKSLPIDGQRPAGRHGVGVGAAHDQ